MALFSRRPKPAAVAQTLPQGALRDFLTTEAPAPNTPADQLSLLAVDIETTGLDPSRDRLLSIGFVPVDGAAIRLAGAGQTIVRSEGGVGQSATFHGITDDAVASAQPLEEALTLFLQALRGRVLLAHHAEIETGFLSRAIEQVWGHAPRFTTVDTMQLQYRLLTKGFDDEPPQGSLRLWAARQQYGLPVYQAHEALTDALACAELYLAQASEHGWQTPLKKLQ